MLGYLWGGGVWQPLWEMWGDGAHARNRARPGASGRGSVSGVVLESAKSAAVLLVGSRTPARQPARNPDSTGTGPAVAVSEGCRRFVRRSQCCARGSVLGRRLWSMASLQSPCPRGNKCGRYTPVSTAASHDDGLVCLVHNGNCRGWRFLHSARQPHRTRPSATATVFGAIVCGCDARRALAIHLRWIRGRCCCALLVHLFPWLPRWVERAVLACF